jgi:hypothetical protein
MITGVAHLSDCLLLSSAALFMITIVYPWLNIAFARRRRAVNTGE